jgi:hypothetical protein
VAVGFNGRVEVLTGKGQPRRFIEITLPPSAEGPNRNADKDQKAHYGHYNSQIVHWWFALDC